MVRCFCNILIISFADTIYKYFKLLWLCWGFTALRHISDITASGQLSKPHSSWASLPKAVYQDLVYILLLLFLNQSAQNEKKDDQRNVFMTKSSENNVPDVGGQTQQFLLFRVNPENPFEADFFFV